MKITRRELFRRLGQVALGIAALPVAALVRRDPMDGRIDFFQGFRRFRTTEMDGEVRNGAFTGRSIKFVDRGDPEWHGSDYIVGPVRHKGYDCYAEGDTIHFLPATERLELDHALTRLLSHKPVRWFKV